MPEPVLRPNFWFLGGGMKLSFYKKIEQAHILVGLVHRIRRVGME